MKEISSFILLIYFVGKIFSQDTTTEGMDSNLFIKIVNQQFGNLMSPQSNNNIGNFASLDLNETEVNLNASQIFRNGSVLGIKVNGGVNDGFLSIFNNSQFNAKFGLDIQYNFTVFGKKTLRFDEASYRMYKDKEAKIKHDSALKKIEIDNAFGKKLLELEKKRLEEKRELLERQLDSALDLKRDSILVEIAKIDYEIGYKSKQISEYRSDANVLNIELNNWKSLEIEKLQREIKIEGFKLNWFSIGGRIENTSFKLFYPILNYDSQIVKKTFLTQIYRIQYSEYNLDPVPFCSYYWSLGSSFSIEDNLSELAKVEINEKRNYGSNIDDRFTSKKFNAYLGEYKDNLKTISLFGDVYWFLFKDNQAAIHIYPQLVIKEKLTPSINTGVGFLVTFKNFEKNDNIINAELYINLLNMTNTNQSSENILSRSDYGIRFTFPINFKPSIE